MSRTDPSALRVTDVRREPTHLSPRHKTTQDYIDEKPVWMDGTMAPAVAMTSMQTRIWLLASAGKFFEGLVIFMTGVALPLLVHEFGLTVVGKGAVSAAPLFGILVGASALGGLSDRYGRKRMFLIEMVLFAVCLTGLVLSPNAPCALAFLFGMGASLGCDYPTAHLIISETIPSTKRGELVLAAFGFQALGALAGTAIGYLILSEMPDLGAWRWMYATAIIPSVAVAAGRFSVVESGAWLASRGRFEEAERETLQLLRRTPPYPPRVELSRPQNGRSPEKSSRQEGYASLFSSENIRATTLASIPWLLQDLGTYGIGLFTPTILAAIVGAEGGGARNIADLIHRDIIASKGTGFLDLLLLFGMIAAIFLVEKVGRIRLQIIGFLGCALGLSLVAASLDVQGSAKSLLLFSGFMLFNFMTNLGPNSMSYLIAGEVFQTRVRGKGMGLAASVAKVGAATTVFLFPAVLSEIGMRELLLALTGASLLGALVTWTFRIETTGVALDRVNARDP